MTRLFLAVTSLLFLVSCATQLSQSPPAGTAGEIAAPELRAGSSWRYSISDGFTKIPRGTIEYRVRSVGADAVTVDVHTNAQESTELYSLDGNWLKRPATNMQVFSYSPAYRAFDFPLVPGKTWHSRATATDPADGRSFPVTIRGQVLGWERIKVPAGEFDTLKVRRVVFLEFWKQGDRGQSIIEETDWYAPSLDQFVRREAVSKYMRLADRVRPSGFVRVGGDDHSDGESVPRYEQDDWLVYELIAHGGR